MDIDLLRRIAEVEDSIDPESLTGKLGWRSRDVGVWPGTLSKLRMEGLLEDTYESNSYHGYRLSEKARALIEASTVEIEADEGPVDLPDDLFADIIGHEDVKELLRACLAAERPVHVLLAGPPALAKTLFLWDIERAMGERACWLVGSAASKAGLWDLVAGRQPRVLLVDELDKMNAADTAALLSLLEGGRLVRAKVGRQMDVQVDIRVVAATNDERRLSPELRSRFAIRRLHAYGRSDFLTVVRGVLVHREGVSEDMAKEIAARLDGRTQDVRDAVRVARLVPQTGVDRAVSLLLPGG
ncbi:MAG: ATP-binding protein [Chloroflexota bacterium]